MPWLECRGLAKRLGSKQVLHELDLSVERGEVLSILGPSGSGKTTLIRLIAGLSDPDAGEIAIAGRVIWGTNTNVSIENRGVGFVFQDYAVWRHMSVAENVGFGLKMAGMSRSDRDRRVREALEAVHIAELAKRYPDQLSGGQQQRLALARTLAARPQLILMDEPLSNVDAALREQLRTEILQAVRAQGATAIYITHDQSEAMAICDRLAIIHDGRILQTGAPEDLYRRPGSLFVANFLGGANQLRGTVAVTDGVPEFVAGTRRMRLAGDVAPGPSDCVFRPEDTVPACSLDCNMLEGSATSSIFMGRCWRVSVQVDDRILQVDWPVRVQPGEDFAFAVPPDRCVTLAAEPN
ncbi:MAG: iron(III) transport system ATP-binding protein [Rhodospirillaceae bacterium]|nr:iron(III) transport system ATP-binding protein [Rhodospirillaceae bacterium]